LLTRPRLLDAGIGLALVIAIFIVYGQVSGFDFIHFDDPVYTYNNPHVQAGLTLDSLKWAFTSVVAGNWGPVTLLSHLLVHSLFRMESGMHHMANVFFHAIAAVFLFAALRRATGARWPSAFVAAIFALHPLHVESVAWVSERKDVLSALFWFWALYAYVRYVEKPGAARYLPVTILLCLGLMSKTMLVTFPFTLLFFDVWPLRRNVSWGQRIVEKIPLFGLVAIGAVVAYIAQTQDKAISTVSLPLRIENALVSYSVYLRQTIWPAHLEWFYLYPTSIPSWETGLAAAILMAISIGAILTWRTHPYFATGWFWYLGTLVPVIGIIQIGAQSHADRYTYIPMVGLSIIVAWGAVDIVQRWPRLVPAIATAGAASCLACTVLAYQQTSYWQDGKTLFGRSLEIDPNNYWSRYNLGLEHYTLGNELMSSGRRAEAIAEFESVLRVKPDWAEADNNLGILLANLPGRKDEAVAHFEAAVRLDPNLAEAQRNLGILLAGQPGRTAEAITHLEVANRLHPDPQVEKLIARLRAGK
jgi:tetratricopeptide (TPR) repeat protein